MPGSVSSAPSSEPPHVVVPFVFLGRACAFRSVGFEAQATGDMWYFEVSVTLFFCADLVATFNSAYLDGDRWIVDRRRHGEDEQVGQVRATTKWHTRSHCIEES